MKKIINAILIGFFVFTFTISCNKSSTTPNSHLEKTEKTHSLTFIIPSYNRAYTIREAIASIYQQNLTIPFEVVITDDGSTDNTQAILKEYAKKYPNFSFYTHQKNLGPSEARNTCVEHAQGDLIFNLDSDNILEPNTVGKRVELLDETGCDAAAFKEVKFFKGSKKNITGKELRDIPSNISNIIHSMSGQHRLLRSGNYLFTKKSYQRVGGYKGRIEETFSFGFRQQAIGTKIALLPNSFYWHRQSKDSTWMRSMRLNLNFPVLLAMLKEHPEIFTIETNKILACYDVKTRNLNKDFSSGTFKTIPQLALDHLFKAYDYEEQEMYERTVEEYLLALAHGAYHEKIHKRLETAKKKLAALIE